MNSELSFDYLLMLRPTLWVPLNFRVFLSKQISLMLSYTIFQIFSLFIGGHALNLSLLVESVKPTIGNLLSKVPSLRDPRCTLTEIYVYK